MDKFDGVSSTVKTWAVTLWAATSGWSIQNKEPKIALLGAVIIFIFWIFDGYNKKIRQDYRARRSEIEKILEEYSRVGEFPAEVSTPRLPTHEGGSIFRNAILFHISFTYIVLFLLSVFLYFSI
ncbi:MAG: hypothetical protein WAW92_03775 [Minisyncoccia bacterium]